MQEIASLELEELKLAVDVLCTAAQWVLPWNWSFQALRGALRASDWGRAELSGRQNCAAILAEFIN